MHAKPRSHFQCQRRFWGDHRLSCSYPQSCSWTVVDPTLLFHRPVRGQLFSVLGWISQQIPSRFTIFGWFWIGGWLKIRNSVINGQKSVSESAFQWNPLERKGHARVDGWLAYRPRATFTDIVERRLPCNGEEVDIALLDNWANAIKSFWRLSLVRFAEAE